MNRLGIFTGSYQLQRILPPLVPGLLPATSVDISEHVSVIKTYSDSLLLSKFFPRRPIPNLKHLLLTHSSLIRIGKTKRFQPPETNRVPINVVPERRLILSKKPPLTRSGVSPKHIAPPVEVSRRRKGYLLLLHWKRSRNGFGQGKKSTALAKAASKLTGVSTDSMKKDVVKVFNTWSRLLPDACGQSLQVTSNKKIQWADVSLSSLKNLLLDSEKSAKKIQVSAMIYRKKNLLLLQDSAHSFLELPPTFIQNLPKIRTMAPFEIHLPEMRISGLQSAIDFEEKKMGREGRAVGITLAAGSGVREISPLRLPIITINELQLATERIYREDERIILELSGNSEVGETLPEIVLEEELDEENNEEVANEIDAEASVDADCVDTQTQEFSDEIMSEETLKTGGALIVLPQPSGPVPVENKFCRTCGAGFKNFSELVDHLRDLEHYSSMSTSSGRMYAKCKISSLGKSKTNAFNLELGTVWEETQDLLEEAVGFSSRGRLRMQPDPQQPMCYPAVGPIGPTEFPIDYMRQENIIIGVLPEPCETSDFVCDIGAHFLEEESRAKLEADFETAFAISNNNVDIEKEAMIAADMSECWGKAIGDTWVADITNGGETPEQSNFQAASLSLATPVEENIHNKSQEDIPPPPPKKPTRISIQQNYLLPHPQKPQTLLATSSAQTSETSLLTTPLPSILGDRDYLTSNSSSVSSLCTMLPDSSFGSCLDSGSNSSLPENPGKKSSRKLLSGRLEKTLGKVKPKSVFGKMKGILRGKKAA